MTKEFITDYGVIEVSNAIFEDDNGTDLFEGIELKDENGNIIEVAGYRDIDDMTIDEVEQIIENN